MSEERKDGVDLPPTLTLAKLYEQQGFLDKAASVYKELLAIEPNRTELEEAIRAIERRLAGVTSLTNKV